MSDEIEVNEDLSMSDEDFLELPAPTFEPAELEDDSNEEGEVEELDEDSDEGLEDDLSSDEDTEDEDEEEGEEETLDETNEDEEEEVVEEEEGEIDYKALHEQLLQPFKANGSEMSVKSVEEAQKLMQMGANYTKKMTALKPNLKILKMLENNELLDEGKLNLLIDVANGDAEAISKLVRDNEIDPLNLNLTEENKYTPKNHTVGDNQVELDEVISRIQDSASFADTMDVVSSKWDETSKRDIANHPHLLEVINEQVSNGIYATVQAEVDRIKVFGGLQELSDFEAYKQVGDQLYAAGKIDLGQKQAPVKRVVSTSPKAKPSDKPRKDKRKAASPVKNSGQNKETKDEFNILNMTEEEFENFKF